MHNNKYIDRDISWLSFNERILMEAQRADVPVGERLSFLGIFSSNLDEFYRVRMPAIAALKELGAEKQKELQKIELVTSENTLLGQVRGIIDRLQIKFGELIRSTILPELCQAGVDFKYNAELTSQNSAVLQAFFYEKVAAYLQMVWLPDAPEITAEKTTHFATKAPRFFPENDTIYLVAFGKRAGVQGMAIIRIPSEQCGRFLSIDKNAASGQREVWMLDDIIRMQLPLLAGADDFHVEGSYSFKLSRDADIDYKDEYGKDLAGFIQKQIGKRNFGLATRLLYDVRMPEDFLKQLRSVLKCPAAALVKGGGYHNLRDFMKFPVKQQHYEKWPPLQSSLAAYSPQEFKHVSSLLQLIEHKDQLVSTPYQTYSTVLRFFNEAAISPEVRTIAVTLYRIASDSLIAHALMTAAKNGKSVTVFVELKARFDEANNIKWARKMRAAGVKIVYSIWALKVHAKIALVKREQQGRLHYSGIVATGNFNENTAGLYADHILMTADKEIMADIETLMLFLEKRARPEGYQFFQPKKLLIAGFNLQQVFLERIQDCIAAAKKGLKASITIKLNNLEEEKLIDGLYEASRAGVKIRLMVRSICRLMPGIPAMSENIEVYRLVDRYLEHSRVFIFDDGEVKAMYIGSADWMNRNIYRRIEVCVPILDPKIAETIDHIVELQFADNVHLVRLRAEPENKLLAAELKNEWLPPGQVPREAQLETYQYLAGLGKRQIETKT